MFNEKLLVLQVGTEDCGCGGTPGRTLLVAMVTSATKLVSLADWSQKEREHTNLWVWFDSWWLHASYAEFRKWNITVMRYLKLKCAFL